MVQGQALLERGDFDGSLQHYRRVLLLAGSGPPADSALFNIGLIYAHPENPRRDNEKAVGSFNTVVDRYPQSQWVGQAKIWLGVLREAEKSRDDIERARVVIENFRQEVEKSRQVIEKSKQVIERSRQVDIEIEQKRRDRGR
jgi:TolA-binding protein